MKLLLCSILCAAVASACSVVYPNLGEVSPQFEVVFERHGKPLAGVRVSIGDASAATGADGVAKFSRVPVGHHTLYGEFHGLQIAAYTVEVRARKSRRSPIRIVWEDEGFAVGRVAGRLVKHQFEGPDLGPIVAAELKLTSVATGVSQSAVSLADGRFDFEQQSPGDYILRAAQGHMLLRVDADHRSRDFRIGWMDTSCGVWLFPKL